MTKFIGGVDFDELRSKRVKNYDTITLALDAAVTDKEFIFTGNYVYIAEATDIDVNLSIRFCEQSRAAINMVHGRAVRTPFYRLYLSWAAQPGKSAVLAMGVGEEHLFEILDTGRALDISGTVESDNTPSITVSEEQRDFYGSYFRASSAAAKGSVGLWNPLTSGVLAFLYHWATTPTDEVRLNQVDAFLFNDIQFHTLDNAFSYSGNKYVGAGNPACRLAYGQLDPIDMSNALYNQNVVFRAQAWLGEEMSFNFKQRRPFCIPPGYGLIGVGFVGIDVMCQVDFQWYEKAI